MENLRAAGLSATPIGQIAKATRDTILARLDDQQAQKRPTR
jgi:hypothetical protein